jgi:hypothetical protein
MSVSVKHLSSVIGDEYGGLVYCKQKYFIFLSNALIFHRLQLNKTALPAGFILCQYKGC